ncbi:C-terminal binding protein [Salinisphaera sp.]|uniref:C-terminal binding protein n=1 Tax=Salinisphaera sp. TaxID=1914330 RepID=UPI002D7983A9|nr:C-terminal binding protein [Salinisphaera sp.]HET7313499.1 C-terminal binding protein [Salinisphaera sp.]
MSLKVVVTDEAFGAVEYERAVADKFGAEFAHHQCADVASTQAAVRDARIAFVNFAPITREVLQEMPPGAVIIRYGIGFDNVDIEAARQLGIRVANVPDYGVDTVADHAATAMVALLRKLPVFDREIRDNGWTPIQVGRPIKGFMDTTIGLLGAGRIGVAVARRLQAFGMTILAADPYADTATLAAAGVELLALEDMLGRVDGLSLHMPLTDETRHVVNAAFIDHLRPGCMVVNTARGGLIDEEAMAAGLERGAIGGAALDVFDPEPLAKDSPLRRLPNVILTPHAAFYSERSLDNLQRLAAEEAERALADEPLRCPVV